MAMTLDKETEAWPAGTGVPVAEPLPPVPGAPDLGRTVRVVGDVINTDMNKSPHPKNARGELGKALFNYQHNTMSHDPLTRVSAPNHGADKRHFLPPNGQTYSPFVGPCACVLAAVCGGCCQPLVCLST